MISKAVEIGRTVDDHKGEKKGMGFRFMKQQQQKGTLPFKTGTTKNGGVPGGNVPSLIRIPQEIKKVKEDSEEKLLCEYSDGAEKNQPYIVRLVVNRNSNELIFVDILYPMGTKKNRLHCCRRSRNYPLLLPILPLVYPSCWTMSIHIFRTFFRKAF